MANPQEIGRINQVIASSNPDDETDKQYRNNSENHLAVSPRTNSKARNGNETKKKHDGIWYCRFIVSHTKFAFAIFVGAHVFMLAITALLVVVGYDILPIAFGALPLEIPKDSTKLRSDAWFYVKDDELLAQRTGKQTPRSIKYSTISMVYELKNGNVFTKENLRMIQESEEDLWRKKTYKDKLCQFEGASGNMTCKLPLSIIRFFDGTYREIHPELYDPNFENISLVLDTAKSLNLSRALLNFHLAKDAVIERNNTKSQYTRTLFYTGWPLDSFLNTDDRKEDQQTELNKIIVDVFEKPLEKKYKDGVGKMNFYYDNVALRIHAIQNQIIYDMMLAIASFVFIFIFLWFHTGSLWLTLWGIFSIISSFNIANLLYRVVFDFRYFGMFHILSIFIILGIGCDDIFIFVDTWKQSSNESFQNLTQRLSKVFRSAAKTTFVTSFTTMVAFLSNVQSPLLAIYSFGLFSAILIMVNYFSIILFFPVILIVHHTSRRGRCCCLKVGNEKETTTKSKRISQHLIRFFEGWLFRNVITHKVSRWIVIFLFTAIAGISVFYSTKLEANKEQIKLFQSNTNWEKVRDLRFNAFRASQEDRVIKVHIIWGLKEQDRSKCHHTDFKCKGKTVLDTRFDLNPPQCQAALLELCDEMKSLSPNIESDLHLRRSQVDGEVEMKCIFERMNEYLTDESKKAKYNGTTNFSFPLDQEKIQSLISSNLNIYKVPLPDNYDKFFEVGAGFFLSQGGEKQYISSFDYRRYKSLIEGEIYPHIFSNTTKGKQYDGRLLYVAMAFNTTVNPSTLGYEKGLKIYDSWEDFVVKKMKTFPPSCNQAFQATVEDRNFWQWLKVQKVLVNNAITGIVIGIVLSLVVLTIATANVIIGFMATLTIGMVTCGVLGMITVLGWNLGFLESINLTLIVGLAVDYVVHLAEGYMVLKNEDRVTRVKYTLGHVGISVFSGACTTLGASIFMLAAKIIFFSQFGIFIFATIGFSILYSLFLFTTVLALIGPEGDTGSLLPIMRKLRKLVSCKEKVDLSNSPSGNGYPVNGVQNNAVIITKL